MNTKTIITELKQILTSNIVLEGCNYKSNNARELNQIYTAYFNGASRVVTEIYAFIEMLEGVNFADELPVLQEALPVPDSSIIQTVGDGFERIVIKNDKEVFIKITPGIVDEKRVYTVKQAAAILQVPSSVVYTMIKEGLVPFICTNTGTLPNLYYIAGVHLNNSFETAKTCSNRHKTGVNHEN